ncbi:MFS transporter [Nibrella saemangeumensis]|uniref:MFS transporter n=1 Tax=Nibrella saemangeumensis TaxID=1084526 RepID=A0ABP8N148_9BACT
MALTNTPASSEPVSIWTAFQTPVFRAIWLAAFVSNIGTWMQNMAGVWLLTTLSQSQVLVALMQTATSLPIFMLSIPAGALADLLDRRRLLLTTQLFMAGVAGLLGVLTLTGSISPYTILSFTFLLGIGAALNTPAWQSIAPELVPRPVLPAALILNGVSINLSRAIGPALGGLIIAHYSPGYVFLLNGVSFLATCAVLYRWKRKPMEMNVPVEDFFSALRAGLRYVRFSPAIHAILIRGITFTFGTSAMWALLSLVVARRLQLDAGVYSSMLTSIGAGAVTGALVLSRIAQRLHIEWRMIATTLTFAGVNLALATVTTAYWLYPVMFLAGIAWLLTLTSLNVTIQLNLPKWVQARVLSIYMLAFQGGLALGSLVWGNVADQYGLSTALLLAAGWLVLVTLLPLFFRLPYGQTPDMTPAEGWPDPPVTQPIRPEQGPVVVMIEYRINPSELADFLKAMEPLKRLRLRDGALRAGVFSDITDPTRQVEFYTVASWGEHLRQHHRFTREDTRIEQQVHRFHTGPDRPVVSHFVTQPGVEQPPFIAGMDTMSG